MGSFRAVAYYCYREGNTCFLPAQLKGDNMSSGRKHASVQCARCFRHMVPRVLFRGSYIRNRPVPVGSICPFCLSGDWDKSNLKLAPPSKRGEASSSGFDDFCQTVWYWKSAYPGRFYGAIVFVILVPHILVASLL